MTTSTYLLAANAAVWLALAGYVAFLALGQARLAKRLKQFETLRDD